MPEKVAVIHAAYEEVPSTVAFVDVDENLSIIEIAEKAFEKTNSIDHPWWFNPEVTLLSNSVGRSTSVGDMVLVGTTKLKCKHSGWDMI